MPILVLHLPNQSPRGLVVDGRVVIGRRPFDTILVPDPTVSRIHAWIGAKGGQFLIYDSGSRSGTFVNDQPVKEPTILGDGDEIRIGPATLTFIDGDALPADIEPLLPSPPPPATDPYDGGIYFDCACGGPMWVAANLAGAAGRCRYCGQRLVVPHQSGKTARRLAPAGATKSAPRKLPPPIAGRAADAAVASPEAGSNPAAPPVVAERHPTLHLPPARSKLGKGAGTSAASARDSNGGLIEGNQAPGGVSAPQDGYLATARAQADDAGTIVCSICQTPIYVDDEQTACPSCHLTFHAQCWEENFGCSAYGCDQVNVLAPRPAQEPQTATAPALGDVADASTVAGAAGQEDAAYPSLFPWEPVLFGLSFAALGLGVLTFGAPSLALLVFAAVFVIRKRPARRGLVILAIVVSLLGTAAGLVTSLFWFKGIRVWELIR